MPKEKTDDLCELPTVGPSKEQLLNNYGYFTYEDLARSHPVSLNQECDIVLASATQIIVSSIRKLEHNCPSCGSSSLEPAWSTSNIDPVSDSSDIQCSSCSWDGKISDATISKKPKEAQH